MQNIRTILQTHKTFAAIVCVTLLLSLIRIPLGTFNEGSVIDTLSHFLLPAFGTPLLFALLTQLNYLPPMKNPGILTLILLMGVMGAVAWEIFEFNVDWFFNLQWQVSNADTMYDLILAVLGSLLGGFIYLRNYITPQYNGAGKIITN